MKKCKNDEVMNMWYNKEEKVKRFLLSIGEAGKIAAEYIISRLTKKPKAE